MSNRNDGKASHEETPLGKVLGDLKRWILQSDADRVEVTLRITVSALLCLILATANIEAVPESQRVLIGSLAPALTMVFPTLLFSIASTIFPAQIVTTILSLAISTMLLCCVVASGKGLYVGIQSLSALWIGPLRFDKLTGASVSILLMMVNLNTLGWLDSVEMGGLNFVKNLWSGSGSYTESIVGWVWICIAMMSGRLLPPFRTVRKSIARATLPTILDDAAKCILQEVNQVFDQEKTGQADGFDFDKSQQPLSPKDCVSRLVHNSSIIATGSLAVKTAYEPRLLRFGRPECSWLTLKELMLSINSIVISALSMHTLPQDRIAGMENRLRSAHLDAVKALKACAASLRKGVLVDGVHMEMDGIVDKEDGEKDIATGEDAPFDPLALSNKSSRVVTATDKWIKTMGPPDRSKSWCDHDTMKALIKNTVPWINSTFGVFLALGKVPAFALKVDSWRRIFIPPRSYFLQFVWTIKNAVGFSALLCMGVYWEAFKNLEIPVRNEVGFPVGSHFQGWFLIAYAFSTTQTAEGTIKKGSLRLIGTVLGAFSAWAALQACGWDQPYGIVAWFTATTVIAVYFSLDFGSKARMGINSDYAWGPAYFVLTQNLVGVEVCVGAGGPNDIALNRIVANCVGIAMAIFLAVLPPGLYGGDPRWALAVLRVEKETLCDCLSLLLEQPASGSEKEYAELASQMRQLLSSSIGRTKEALDRANDFYGDASKLHRLPIFKVDPKLGQQLERLTSLASLVFSLLRISTSFLEKEQCRGVFAEGSENRDALLHLVEELSPGSSKSVDKPAEEEDGSHPELNSPFLVDYMNLAVQKLNNCESILEDVRWGMCGQQSIY